MVTQQLVGLETPASKKKAVASERDVVASEHDAADRILTSDALSFLTRLHHEFNIRRLDLLEQRRQRQQDIDAGDMPDFLPETADVRKAEWRVAAAPRDLQDRRVEIAASAESDTLRAALDSGANVVIADLEDALSPTWNNVLGAHANITRAVTSRAAHSPALIVRPRGLHLIEKHVLVDGTPMSASLFDFGLHMFHSAQVLLDSGSGPYFYLPKLENRLEARLWHDIFAFAEEDIGITRGCIRATPLIETILAVFEMDEILYELRDFASGLNAGRWDYIFSFIKTFRHREELVLPDRTQLTMSAPFMTRYAELLVRTCHRRGAHAIGGDAAQGFDGTWVTHPSEVAGAKAAFDAVLGDAPHQKHVQRTDVRIAARDVLDPRIPEGRVTRNAICNNVDVALRYMTAWLGGRGALAIDNVVEDAAAAEIARAQLWQWRRHAVPLDAAAEESTLKPQKMSAQLYRTLRNERRAALEKDATIDKSQLAVAVELLDTLVLSNDFLPFLTLPGYLHLA